MVDTSFKKALDFRAIRIRLASPETIRSWSHGEVTKPETINYRSYKPERDGLFCEKIFGPVRDWECHCGKYKRIRYKGVICDRCGVEVTQSKVRRERMGHIELAVPVSHIWYFKSVPSRMSYLLDVSVRNLEKVLYYECYIVIDPGDATVEKKQLLYEEELNELRQKGYNFVAEMGAEAIKKLLAEIDVEDQSAELRAEVKVETSVQRKQELLKRLKVVEAFRQSGNRPEWMILEVIPVLPPDLRPLVPLEGGRFATSDLNDLYRRVINRNNRLKKLMQIKAPEVILRNERRMLQEAVDSLFDNGRRSKAVMGDANRSLKSLSDLLRGKQGRFRQNLLGKRVDYSGRSVIVVGPELKLNQCGLPKNMALELFKPFIIKKLEDRGLVQTVKSAKKLVEREEVEVWDILEETIKDHYVLLNRAPTLHRLGIQAFVPVLVEGKAIKIHPLVCAAFNADFDGDQMPVHLPLSAQAQREAKELMLSTKNILLPADGTPVIYDKPQDIALGCYYLTKMKKDGLGKGKIFANPDEANIAFEYGKVSLHSDIRVRMNGKIIETTVGRIIFNSKLPNSFEFINEAIDKKHLKEIIAEAYRSEKQNQGDDGYGSTAKLADAIKDMGFYYATTSGVTIGMDDVIVPPQKKELIENAMVQVGEITEQYRKGIVTDGERYNRVIDIWTNTKIKVVEATFEVLEDAEDGFNSIFMMAASGARGSKDQIGQLGGMRGLMQKPLKKFTGTVGELIESPVTANFREGLTVSEYFISAHGARKGLADTALKTADAGYLTRRLVDVAQDVIVDQEDCGTTRGIEISALKEGEDIVEPLSDRILGRVVSLDDIVDPTTSEVIVHAGEEIDEESAREVEDSGIETVRIRSVLTCESRRGVCVKCYGRNLATGQTVNIGEAVGVIAAQSIGEPGTQLTLRTFHIGGTASVITEQSHIVAKKSGLVQSHNMEAVEREQNTFIVVSRNGEIEIVDEKQRSRGRYHVPYGAQLMVKEGQEVAENEFLYEWDPYSNIILTDKAGIVKFFDIREGVTVREDFDEVSGRRQPIIVEQRDRSLNPRIEVVGEDGERLRNYMIPIGARLQVHDGENVPAGHYIAKIPREVRKTRDITGGLPRVVELFEARRPKEPAVVTEIDGIVKLGGMVRGSREVIVTNESGEERKYQIPYGKHLRAHTGDRVVASERLSEGSVNPHDILKILGVNRVQEYLVNEIQAVYRLQAVKINDKHIEIIVRQMMQKVKIVDPGDTNFLEGDLVERFHFENENRKVIDEDGEPATAEPVLLGITRASLMTDSFISASAFQETTRVLTDAAIQGKVDRLLGLKENVIIGHLIPAGTGLKRYREIASEPTYPTKPGAEVRKTEEEKVSEIGEKPLELVPEVAK